MAFAVIDGGYEEHMRRLSDEADRGMMEILGYVPDCSRPKAGRLAYLFALYEQRDERARRRYLVERRGNCAVLMPAAWNNKQ